DLVTGVQTCALPIFNTLYMFLELPLSIVLGVGLALLLNQRLRGMPLFRTIFYLPVLVPTVASALLWLWLLNPQYGLANRALERRSEERRVGRGGRSV